MKYLISNSQYKLLMEQEDDILEVPFEVFNNNWNTLQKFLERRNYPPYKLLGDVDLQGSNITDLGNLISIDGNLKLHYSKIESLGNLKTINGNLNLYYTKIKSLGNLTTVDGWLDLSDTKIESIGNLTYVGYHLDLSETPLSKTMSKKEIRQIVSVEGDIYL